jgi:PAT family beta-lactamase induction signal transducer AmpG
MLLAQLGIIAGLMLLSTTDPLESVLPVAAFALLASFSSATQDIAIDAWRIEAVEAERQGAMAANYQFGYRLGVLVSGAGALFLADAYDWSLTYLAMAACMGVGVAAVLLIAEPEHPEGVTKKESVSQWVQTHVVQPFADIFRRYRTYALAILAFVALFRFTDYVMGPMAYPFYLDMGYSLSEIGAIVKLYGTAATLVGVMVGGLVVSRYGLRGPLIASAILLALTNLTFAALATTGETDLWLLAGVITGDNFSAGLSGTAFITFLSSLTSRQHTATQYALLTSLMALPGKFLTGFSGFLSLEVGWVNFFAIVCLAGVPGILLAVFVTRLKFLQSSGGSGPN